MSDDGWPPFRTLHLAFADWWREWVRMAAVNLAWASCCLTVVLAPPATVVLVHAMRELRDGRDLAPGELLRVGRRLFLRSWLWFLPNGLVAVLVAANLLYYGRFDPVVSFAVRALLALGLVLWSAVQFYVLPYLVVQDGRGLGRAYRNALLTSLASPLYTVVLLVAVGIVIALSFRFLPLLFLGGPCLVAMTATHAVADRLDRFGVRDRA